MKRFIIVLSLLMMAMMTIGTDASAQAKITTRKYRLSDFPTKTTKVVVDGNGLLEGSVKEEIQKRWRISPFEFCSTEEYNQIKTNSDYYFLICSQVRGKGEESQSFYMLSMTKGGKEDAQEPLKKPMDIIDVPLASADSPSGREIAYMPAMIDILQDYVEKAMSSEADAYAKLSSYNKNITKLRDKDLTIADCDLAPGVEDFMSAYPSVNVVDEDKADEAFQAGVSGLISSYVVAPEGSLKGSYYYLMLIDAASHELYLYKKCKIKKDGDVGFHESDIKTLASNLRKR